MAKRTTCLYSVSYRSLCDGHTGIFAERAIPIPPCMNLASIDLERFLASSRPSDRQLFEDYLQGYALHEIASRRGITHTALRIRLFRRRRAIRSCIPQQVAARVRYWSSDNRAAKKPLRSAVHSTHSLIARIAVRKMYTAPPTSGCGMNPSFRQARRSNNNAQDINHRPMVLFKISALMVYLRSGLIPRYLTFV
jgi:hypothetical protein